MKVECDVGDTSRPQEGVPLGSQEVEQWMEVDYTISFVDNVTLEEHRPRPQRHVSDSSSNQTQDDFDDMEVEHLDDVPQEERSDGVLPEKWRQKLDLNENNSSVEWGDSESNPSLEWQDSRFFDDFVLPEKRRPRVQAVADGSHESSSSSQNAAVVNSMSAAAQNNRNATNNSGPPPKGQRNQNRNCGGGGGGGADGKHKQQNQAAAGGALNSNSLVVGVGVRQQGKETLVNSST